MSITLVLPNRLSVPAFLPNGLKPIQSNTLTTKVYFWEAQVLQWVAFIGVRWDEYGNVWRTVQTVQEETCSHRVSEEIYRVREHLTLMNMEHFTLSMPFYPNGIGADVKTSIREHHLATTHEAALNVMRIADIPLEDILK